MNENLAMKIRRTKKENPKKTRKKNNEKQTGGQYKVYI